MRILVVEDSPTALLHMRNKLRDLGHEVVTATNGKEAWEHLQHQHEALVITDWMMPEMDGLELCRQIRARGGFPYTYVILVTVKDLRKDVLAALHAGADAFLTKPPDTVELQAALAPPQRIMESHRLAAVEAGAGAGDSVVAG